MVTKSRTQPLKVAFLQALLSIAVAFFLVGGDVARAVTTMSSGAEMTTEGVAPQEIGDPVPDSPAESLALTLTVSPNHGYAGEEIQVSGTGDLAFPGVRVAWWVGEATETVAILPFESDGSFNTTVSVPVDAPAGAVQVCVAHDGTERTRFVCTPFTVDVPPPGQVRGQIALSDPSQPVDASLTLYDLEGTAVATTSIQADGSFLTPDVAPGTYEASFEGTLADVFATQDVAVQPGAEYLLTPDKITVPCTVAHVGAVTNILVSTGVRTNMLKAPTQSKIYGTYLSLGAGGSEVMVGFTPIIQTTPDVTIEQVEFYVRTPDGGETLFATDTTGPIWQAAYNVSLLPPGYNTILVKVTAQEGCIKENSIRLWVLPNPMSDPLLRNAQVSFDWNTKQYNFTGTFINAADVLPLVYPDPPPSLPVIGTIENRFDAGVHFAGNMTLNGDVTLTSASFDALVRLFNIDLYNKSETWVNKSVPIGKRQQASYNNPSSYIAYFNKKIPIYSGPVATFLGIVTVNASLSIGMKGDVTLHATLKPMQPHLYLYLTPRGGPYFPISVSLTFLGFAIASLTGTTEVTADLPLKIDAHASLPVGLDDPCLRLRFWLELWIGIDYYVGSQTLYDDTFDIFEKTWGACSSLAAQVQQAQNKPRIMAAPVVASGPDGAMLSVYVEDTTPAADTITPVVMGRFWDTAAGVWGAPLTLSDGQHYVSDPAVTFMGTSGQALVVWTENTLSRSETVALGTDLNAILAHQEVFYNAFDGANWTGPVQVTSDSLPDGFASVAGDAAGGATLAWVVDTDGDLATRTDLEIRTAEWGAGAAAADGGMAGGDRWGSRQTLTPSAHIPLQAAADTAMDVQPAVIRTGDPDLPAAIIWTRDLDGEPSTNDDRTLALARLTPDGWTFETPGGLPPGTDSPAIGWDTDQKVLYLAFLARDKDPDGVTETGVGDQAVLWSGQWTEGGGWENVSQLLDEHGNPLRAEAPRIQVQPDVEALVLFRRFAEGDSPGQLGNLALSRRTPWGDFGPPLYLLDVAEQHWMSSMAIDTSGQAMVVSVERVFSEAAPPVPLASRRAIPAAGVATLSAATDPVESLLLSPDPDPALDPDLVLSEVHAASGATVVVSATVRNVGRAPATALSVNLYSGLPGDGTLVDTIVLVDPLEFNASQEVNFDIAAAGGRQPIYVEVVTEDSDASARNNTAIADLGRIPAPKLVGITANKEGLDALQITWVSSEAGGVEGYRILRGEAPGGPYVLVGQSLGNTYVDDLLEPGVTYYYAVQAYDATGVYSPYSNEGTAGSPFERLYLPIIQS